MPEEDLICIRPNTDSTLVRQLVRRFGGLSDNQVEQIRQLSVPQLEDLGESLLDFKVLADLVGFLADMESSSGKK